MLNKMLSQMKELSVEEQSKSFEIMKQEAHKKKAADVVEDDSDSLVLKETAV